MKIRCDLAGRRLAEWIIVLIVMIPLMALADVGGVFAPKAPPAQTNAEKALGECLALNLFLRYGPPVKNVALHKYVNWVGSALVNTLPQAPYPLHVIVIGGSLYRSFGLPGGIIVIGEAKLKQLTTEAELAAVIAYEMAHILRKHAFQLVDKGKLTANPSENHKLTSKKIIDKKFINLLNQLQEIIFERGYKASMISAADDFAMNLLYRTGYNPESVTKVLLHTQSQPIIHVFNGPPLTERIAHCRQILEQYPDYRSLAVNSERFNAHVNRR